MSFVNPTPEAIAALLDQIKTIAVVGLSPKTSRPSYSVSRMMKSYGYQIVPVRPAVDEVLGEKAYATLDDLPMAVDCVNVFRNAAELDPVIDAAIRIKAPVVWIQEGIVNEAAALRAQAAGITVIMDRCIYKDYIAHKVSTS